MITYGQAVGQALRNVRHEKQYSLRQVSIKCYISPGHISDIERGTKTPSHELLEDLAIKGLGITTETLVREIYQALQGKAVSNE